MPDTPSSALPQMHSPAAAPSDTSPRARGANRIPPYGGLRAAAPALALGLLGLGLIFWREGRAAVEVWEVSTAYNHCFLVLPIALWMAWDRRDTFRRVAARPLPWLALAALPIAAAWFLADRIGVMEGRQLTAMALVQLLFLAVLGWDLWRRLSAPLLYLIFLVPFGAFLTPVLQDFTAAFVVRGLDILGILHYTDGYIIEMSVGTFFVAEACAGLRFLIASVAFGTLYACTIYRSPTRRAAFIAVSIIVPIIANGFRALGIVLLGHYLGSAQAGAADHIIYGWGFFSAVTLLLILIGLPFRQDRDPPARPARSSVPITQTRAVPLATAAAVLSLGAFGPGASALLDRAGAPPRLATAPDIAADCRPIQASLPAETSLSASLYHYSCADDGILLSLALFSPHANPGLIVQGQRVLSGETIAREADVTWVGDAPRWRVLESRDPLASRATALWLNGRRAGLGLAARIDMARASLLGGATPPILVALTPRIDWAGEGPAGRARARQAMIQFLANHPGLDARIGALATPPGR